MQERFRRTEEPRSVTSHQWPVCASPGRRRRAGAKCEDMRGVWLAFALWAEPGAAAAFAPGCVACQATAVRRASARMLEPPFKLPYEVPPMPKVFSDYEWDDSYPGTFKPGKRKEDWSTDDVFELWKDRENPNAIEMPRDELWAVPLAPPEDILSWLDRIGLLDDAPEEEPAVKVAESSLLEEEFDLEDGESDAELAISSMLEAPKESGATMSDFL